MATKQRTNSIVQQPNELIKSKQIFSEELSERILLGKTISEKSLNSEHDYDLQQKNFSNWNDYNSELLKQSFNNVHNEYVLSYDKAGIYIGIYNVFSNQERNRFDDYETFKNKVLAKIDNLEKLSQKTNLLKSTINEPIKTEYKNDSLDNKSVFIVHGHDELAKTEVARFLEKLNLKAIILHEQPNSGNTIIEKIEKYSNVGFGIVLYTPCDVGSNIGNERELKKRARQNVVFEHGYLIGKIGRKNVCALVKGDIETPNDISGVVYIGMESNWKFDIAKELKESGYSIDMNLI